MYRLDIRVGTEILYTSVYCNI